MLALRNRVPDHVVWDTYVRNKKGQADAQLSYHSLQLVAERLFLAPYQTVALCCELAYHNARWEML